jgi:hypothetical protein
VGGEVASDGDEAQEGTNTSSFWACDGCPPGYHVASTEPSTYCNGTGADYYYCVQN